MITLTAYHRRQFSFSFRTNHAKLTASISNTYIIYMYMYYIAVGHIELKCLQKKKKSNNKTHSPLSQKRKRKKKKNNFISNYDVLTNKSGEHSM